MSSVDQKCVVLHCFLCLLCLSRLQCIPGMPWLHSLLCLACLACGACLVCLACLACLAWPCLACLRFVKAHTCTGVVFGCLASVLPSLSGLPGLPGKIKAYQRVGKLPDTALRLHIHKTIADLFPDGFIWTPFRPDLDQAIFEPRDTIPKLWHICFQMASFGHLYV